MGNAAHDVRLIAKYFGSASRKLIQSQSLSQRTSEAFKSDLDNGFVKLFGKPGRSAASNGGGSNNASTSHKKW